jgi:hypothetical protein
MKTLGVKGMSSSSGWPRPSRKFRFLPHCPALRLMPMQKDLWRLSAANLNICFSTSVAMPMGTCRMRNGQSLDGVI